MWDKENCLFAYFFTAHWANVVKVTTNMWKSCQKCLGLLYCSTESKWPLVSSCWSASMTFCYLIGLHTPTASSFVTPWSSRYTELGQVHYRVTNMLEWQEALVSASRSVKVWAKFVSLYASQYNRESQDKNVTGCHEAKKVALATTFAIAS